MRLVLRMLDEDDAVKDLAIKAIEELWFQIGNSIIPKNKGDQLQDRNDKTALLYKVSIIMSVAAGFKDRLSPLEDTLHKIISTKEGAEANLLHTRYVEVCETLIDGLVDASDLPGFVSSLSMLKALV
jgi:cohesin loading factor subunit SCC2